VNPKKFPHVTPDIVADEQLLANAVEALLVEHPDMVRHRRRIVRRQEALQRLVSPEAWQRYLKVEEATNVRYDLALRLVAAWAFERGRKCGR